MFALYQLVGIYFSWRLELWASLPFLALFASGYGYVFALSAWRQLAARRTLLQPPPSTTGLAPGAVPGRSN